MRTRSFMPHAEAGGLSLRPIPPPPSDKRPPARHCARCRKPTAGGKPFCPDHLFENDYAREVAESWEARLAEEARTKQGRARLDGPLWDEILSYLRWQGPKATIARMRRDLGIDEEAVQKIVHNAARKGLVRVALTKRGYLLVTLLEDSCPA